MSNAMAIQTRSADAAVASADARLKAMVSDHFAFVWRALRGLGVPSSAADDAAQQVFLTVAQRVDEITPGTEKSFLFGTARRVAANARRSADRRLEVLDPEALLAELDHGADPETLLQMRQARALLDAVLDAMPDKLRTVFVLFVLEGLAIAEIAEILAIPVGTVGSRLRRAREEFNATVKRMEARIRTGGVR
jgi:RNA polymerase sigma-70 factor (ECF subfamily)